MHGERWGGGNGIGGLVPHGVVEKPGRNAAALPCACRARLGRIVGALSTPALSLESDRDRPAGVRPEHSRLAVRAPDRPASGGHFVWASEELCANLVQFMGSTAGIRRVAGDGADRRLASRLHRALPLASHEAIFSARGPRPARGGRSASGARAARFLSAGTADPATGPAAGA